MVRHAKRFNPLLSQNLPPSASPLPATTSVVLDFQLVALFAFVTGGTASYSYSWSNGSTSNVAFALAAGTYTLTVHRRQQLYSDTIGYHNTAFQRPQHNYFFHYKCQLQRRQRRICNSNREWRNPYIWLFLEFWSDLSDCL